MDELDDPEYIRDAYGDDPPMKVMGERLAERADAQRDCLHQWSAWGYRDAPNFADGELRVTRFCRCGAKQVRKASEVDP